MKWDVSLLLFDYSEIHRVFRLYQTIDCTVPVDLEVVNVVFFPVGVILRSCCKMSDNGDTLISIS
jgi:hypothetical protein